MDNQILYKQQIILNIVNKNSLISELQLPIYLVQELQIAPIILTWISKPLSSNIDKLHKSEMCWLYWHVGKILCKIHIS